jgi:hypothetical protein
MRENLVPQHGLRRCRLPAIVTAALSGRPTVGKALVRGAPYIPPGHSSPAESRGERVQVVRADIDRRDAEDGPSDWLAHVDPHPAMRRAGKRHVAVPDRAADADCRDPMERTLDLIMGDVGDRRLEPDTAEADTHDGGRAVVYLGVREAAPDTPEPENDQRSPSCSDRELLTLHELSIAPNDPPDATGTDWRPGYLRRPRLALELVQRLARRSSPRGRFRFRLIAQ